MCITASPPPPLTCHSWLLEKIIWGERHNERDTFIRINPGFYVDKKSILFVMVYSWQIKDLFARDLTLTEQKLIDLKAGFKEVILTVMRLFLCGLWVDIGSACCLSVILTGILIKPAPPAQAPPAPAPGLTWVRESMEETDSAPAWPAQGYGMPGWDTGQGLAGEIVNLDWTWWSWWDCESTCWCPSYLNVTHHV